MKIILASSSPRRKQLLAEILQNFDIVPAIGEEKCSFCDPTRMVAELSRQKAAEVAKNFPNDIVIGCDTVVSFAGVVFGKPKDASEARQMLGKLSANKHEVFTGVCIAQNGKIDCFVEKTIVQFRRLLSEEIDAYISSGSCFDKAGAYGIQETDFVENIEGSFSNVMGLPLETLSKKLFEKKILENGIAVKKWEETKWHNTK